MKDYDYGVEAGPSEREAEVERQRERDRDLEQNRERERRGHQSHGSLQQYSQSAPSLATSSQQASAPAALNRHIVVSINVSFLVITNSIVHRSTRKRMPVWI